MVKLNLLRPSWIKRISWQTTKKHKAIKKFILDKTQGRCYWCKCALEMVYGSQNSFVVDHKRPLALGGSNELFNLVPSCQYWVVGQFEFGHA